MKDGVQTATRKRRLGCFTLPALRFFDAMQDDESHDDRREAAPEHRPPAVVRSDGVVERRSQKEAGVIAGLQITRTHLATVFRPCLSDVGPGQRPLTANADARQQTEKGELPYILGQRRGSREDGVNKDGGRQDRGAAKAVGDGTPEDRKSVV